MRSIYKGRVVNLDLEEVTLPNGRTITLEMIRHPGAAAVVPLRDDGRVVVIRQFRHAAAGTILEIPAGGLKPGEAPLACARRELAEEAGFDADRWENLGEIFTTPGFTDERIHLFLAQGLVSVGNRPDEDEVIEVEEYPLDELIAMIRRGEIKDGKTICGLMMTYLKVRAKE